MSKTVFISRALAENSPFRNILTAKGWTVAGESLVTLSPLPVSVLPPSDWIFFSSQNAVRFFFAPTGPPFTTAVKWAALGPATAAVLQDFVANIDFTGNGDPTSSAENFAAFASSQRVLFPGALHAQESLRQALGERIIALPIALYDNQPVAHPARRDEQVLVFTSPMNASAYFSQHPKQVHQQLVAIGQTTAAILRKMGLEATVATTATEEGLAAAVTGAKGLCH